MVAGNFSRLVPALLLFFLILPASAEDAVTDSSKKDKINFWMDMGVGSAAGGINALAGITISRGKIFIKYSGYGPIHILGVGTGISKNGGYLIGKTNGNPIKPFQYAVGLGTVTYVSRGARKPPKKNCLFCPVEYEIIEETATAIPFELSGYLKPGRYAGFSVGLHGNLSNYGINMGLFLTMALGRLR